MEIGYSLVRQRRKTLAVYVRADGVEVRAPLSMPVGEIETFLSQKRDWIERRLAEVAGQVERRADFEVGYGSRLLYRGRECLVRGVAGRRVVFDGAFCLPVNLPTEGIKRACVGLYRQLARRDLADKVARYAAVMGVRPAGIKVNGAKTRWGSCSSKGNLNFSWRLMMAEDGVINYVVVHELAHLVHMDHSARFWAVVAGIMPDYKARQKQLKALQKQLAEQDWD